MQIKEPLLHHGLVLYAGKGRSMSIQSSFGLFFQKAIKQRKKETCMPFLLW